VRQADDDQSINAERRAGQAWAQAYMDYSDALIRSGKDPDNESNYAAFYNLNGSPTLLASRTFADFEPRDMRTVTPIDYGAAAIVIVVTIVGWRTVQRFKKMRTQEVIK
jgi:hypothetical protein